MPFAGLSEFGHQQYGRCQKSFGGIVEVSVLPERGCIHPREDDRFGNYLRVFFRFGSKSNVIRILLREVHVLVDQMQQVVAVRACRVTQINDRDVVTVDLADVTVVAHDIALGIGGKKTHSRGQSILDTRVEPVGCLTHTGSTKHECMDVASIHEGSVPLRTSHDQSLWNRLFRDNDLRKPSFSPDKVTEPQC